MTPKIRAGTRVRVEFTRCVTKEDGCPPSHPIESYEATIVREGPTGMIYVLGSGGRVGVVHPDAVHPISDPPSPTQHNQ